MKKILNQSWNIYLSISMIFRQAAKLLSNNSRTSVFLGGNVDPFYLIAPLYWIDEFRNKERIKKTARIVVASVLFVTLQWILIPNYNIVKAAISVIKLGICFSILLFFRDKRPKVNLNTVLVIFSSFLFIQLIIALTVGKNSFLWRFNDGVNLYNLTRLQLFFLEPSELGYHISIIVIIDVAKVLIRRKITVSDVVIVFINLLSLYFAKPMGSILFLAVSLFIMTFYYIVTKTKFKKSTIIIALIALVTLLLIILLTSKSGVVLRLIDTLTGKDGSNNYRIGVSLKVLRQSLTDYNLLGGGLGMINTPSFIESYNYLGLTTVVVNSYLYFFIETGIVGILLVSLLIYKLIKSTISKKSVLRLGLLVFIVGYQFTGSHFTSGLNWMIYGFILSTVNENNLFEMRSK